MRTQLANDFYHDLRQQKFLADALDLFAEICAATAERSGFHEDEQKLREVIGASDPEKLAWFEAQLLQAEFGRMMSEAGEGIEAVRKSLMDDHLPDYPGWLCEIADMMIRGGDSAGKRYAGFGQIVVEKMLYNISRPYKHGKNS